MRVFHSDNGNEGLELLRPAMKCFYLFELHALLVFVGDYEVVRVVFLDLAVPRVLDVS